MAEMWLEALMADFVSAHSTHRYVQELEQRVEALERLIAALEQRSVAVAAPKPMTPARKEYMRNFMAEKRRKEREQAAS